ncbi:hypothetical protein [Paenibacillus sp. Soil787]|uniref:hypothetical protein n=1 Tax=Paenibacillus sp. Soil787 TaxID=1736411 RepID=UPI0006FA54F7|nr:hypothetical protein [Paenibacillus sp. Soil787]KRF42284.1 hypothetical protein ASG93_21575 [Paenibacillus sp. Soil787]
MGDLTMQEVCSWFEANKDKSIMIKKEDQQDIDQIEINVHEVGVVSFSDTLDAYLSPKAIVLRGSGSIQTHDGEKQSLPEDSYEIPFDGNFHGIQNEKGMEIQTDRASYMITIQ